MHAPMSATATGPLWGLAHTARPATMLPTTSCRLLIGRLGPSMTSAAMQRITSGSASLVIERKSAIPLGP